MAKIDWTRFTRKIYIDASILRVYECWVKSYELETWFLRQAEYIAPDGRIRGSSEPAEKGDSFRWQWHHWDGMEEGKLIEANGKDRISFTFADSQVNIALKGERQMCLLELSQEGIPTDEKSKYQLYYGCGTGWTFWLANLKAYLEHFILLHDTEPDLTGLQDGIEFVNI